jgi:hypothetical protein
MSCDGYGMKQILVLTACFVGVLLAPARGQDEGRTKKLFDDAIQAMGGTAYLNVKDMVSEGNIFGFDLDGNSGGLVKYNDWTKLPDKSRNEQGNRRKERDVVVFNLEQNQGWILEGQKDTRDASPEEMNDFKSLVKHSIDNIFRFRYQDSANKLFYLGPGERSDVRFELVKLLDPENDEVILYFDRITKLPGKIEYRVTNKRGIKERCVEEFSQWHIIQGVNTPLRVDSFVNGRKSSQTFPLKITYNNNLPDSIFSKPVPPK